jgi:enterochelin esterase-like enzyme
MITTTSNNTPFSWRRLLAGIVAIAALAAAAGAGAAPHVFELDAPAARQVDLAGEMTDWDRRKLPMQQAADGKWRVTVDLAPGQWVYKFVVDGRWIADPANPDQDADGQGGRHSFIFVGPGDWQPPAPGRQGRVDTLMLASKVWGKAMKVNVYLPPGFERGRPAPVLWLLHGAGMDADQWLKTGRVDRYMDNLLARGAIRPFVIVMPSSEAVPYTGRSERFITQELPAWLARSYGLKAKRAQTAIAGMSLGGLGAFRLPIKRPDLYGMSFALSGFYDDPFIGALARTGSLPMQTILVCGSEDPLVATNRKLVTALHARGARFSYREDPGGHTWHYWSQRMVEMLSAADEYFGRR